jgi:MarR family transcriptional regulator, lower aerobic nicotinate degradation pathway regulator
VLNELEVRGLLRRTPDPADRRRNIISITRPGDRQLTRLDTLVTSLQDALLAPLSTADREQLVDLLSRLIAYHTTAAGPR